MTTNFVSLFDRVADLMDYAPLFDLGLAERSDLEEAVRAAKSAADLPEPFAGWLNTAQKNKSLLDGMTATDAGETVKRSQIIKGGPGSGNRGHIGRPGGRGGSAPSYFDHRISNEKIAQLKHRNPSATVEIVTLTPRQQETYAELYESLKKLGSAGWARIQAIEREAKFAPLILGGTPQSWWVEDGAYRLAIIAHRGKSNFFAFFNTLPAGPTKGGPGSGNHRHDGIPGHQGGSKPGDGTDDDLSASHRMELSNGRVVISGDLGRLKEFGLTPQDLEDLSDLGVDNVQTQIEVTVKGRGDRYLEIKGEWDHITQLEHIGNFERTLDRTEMTATMSALHLKSAYMGQGNGTRVARNWYQKLADAGYQKATLFANSTVGMYAWAREGAQYAYANQPAHQTRKFAEWVKSKKIPGLEGALPTFSNPQDVADYYHPEGYSVKGSQIDNAAVKPDAVLHLGKAFMLDSAGHSAWDAIINLADWKGRSRKSVTVADLIAGNDDDDLCYVDMDHSIPGASDAVFFAQYLSEDEGSPIFGFVEGSTNKHSNIIKGGEGSGNHGHRGILGEQGGSMPAGGDERNADHNPNRRSFPNGVTLISDDGEVGDLERFGITADDLAELYDLNIEGAKAKVTIDQQSTDSIMINGTWSRNGDELGKCRRTLNIGTKEVELQLLSLKWSLMGKGLGTQIAQNWHRKMAAAGYEKATLFADLTIGVYAWAKEGAQYADKGKAAEMTKRFMDWADSKEIPGYEDGSNFPTFTNPQDVANHKHPDGVTISSSKIRNAEVNSGIDLPLGKAFMLDKPDGHNSWAAFINLKDWKDKDDPFKAVAVSDLIGDDSDPLVYIEVGQDVPGGSDALFWAQYAGQDEGKPMFGFVEGSTNKRGRIIKGGPGSGNFKHKGRPGHRGGSDNDGVPNDGSGGGTLTAGEMTSVGASSGEARSPVNFEDPRYVESSITGYTQGSPGLSKVVNSSEPLPAQYLTTPAGQARGSQFLPQMMKDMGIDKNLPNQKSLTHGAKSLYLELTDDEELNRLLSKVPPDPAHSSGFWVPGKAAGGGAHGQLKKDAKEGDGKKLEKARKKEEARVKPLMMSAVLQAAMSNDYSLANALQVHYQLVGNLGTFSLLMGYSTINMGASLGTIVMDRGEIEVDPEIVTRIPVGYGTGRRRRGRIIKGGPGSGYHRENGHMGRPGQRGGSSSDGVNDSDDVGGNRGQKKFPQYHVTLEGDLELLEEYGFQPEDIAEISYLDDDTHALINVTLNADPDLVEHYGDDYLTISGIFINPDTGREVGSFERHLMTSSNKAHLQVLAFDNDYLNRGFGSKVARNWFSALADAGYTQADFLADMTIGKYAWAKEGVQYANPRNVVKGINERFAAWCKQKKIPGLLDRRNRPVFKTPQDVANYKHPRAYKVKGRDIVNKDVDKNAEFHVGKAFMLDENGHGEWEAVIDLRDWKGKKGKALKAVAVGALVGGDAEKDELCYVQVGRDFPGGSDAAFWAQYTGEDEGEPIFGFQSAEGKGKVNDLVPQMTDAPIKSKRGKIIKGTK